MKRTLPILTALLLLTACNPNTPSAISVKNKIYKHPTAVQYLKFKTDSVLYYGDFGNKALSNHTFAYSQKDEVVTVYTPTPEHLLAYEGFVERGNTIYELFADTSDPNYQDHQPQDPKAFSLVGKRYATTPDADNWADTLAFYTDSTGARYAPNRFENYAYAIDYPYLTICFDTGGKRPLIFQDTATLYSDWWSETFYLLPSN